MEWPGCILICGAVFCSFGVDELCVWSGLVLVSPPTPTPPLPLRCTQFLPPSRVSLCPLYSQTCMRGLFVTLPQKRTRKNKTKTKQKNKQTQKAQPTSRSELTISTELGHRPPGTASVRLHMMVRATGRTFSVTPLQLGICSLSSL